MRDLVAEVWWALQWGRDLAVTETLPCWIKRASRTLGFNGAVTLRSRKPHRLLSCPTATHGLQWGRDLAVTETLRAACAACVPPRLQWGRDLAVTETAPAQMPARPALYHAAASGLRRPGKLAAASRPLIFPRSPETPHYRPFRPPSAHPSPPRRSQLQLEPALPSLRSGYPVVKELEPLHHHAAAPVPYLLLAQRPNSVFSHAFRRT